MTFDKFFGNFLYCQMTDLLSIKKILVFWGLFYLPSSQRVLNKDQLFGYMNLDLPAPVSHPIFQAMC
jgi:hypothetical protein